jgi:hypothetical protein
MAIKFYVFLQIDKGLRNEKSKVSTEEVSKVKYAGL